MLIVLSLESLVRATSAKKNYIISSVRQKVSLTQRHFLWAAGNISDLRKSSFSKKEKSYVAGLYSSGNANCWLVHNHISCRTISGTRHLVIIIYASYCIPSSFYTWFTPGRTPAGVFCRISVRQIRYRWCDIDNCTRQVISQMRSIVHELMIDGVDCQFVALLNVSFSTRVAYSSAVWYL